MELDKEQLDVAEKLIKGTKLKQEQTLGGYAGTGKTRVVSYLRQRLPKFAVCAFTGKAANVLRKKGVHDASTIHSLIYIPVPQEKGQVLFELRDDIDAHGFIVDEASMVNVELYEDMKSFGRPIIFVGDHGQLEPVGNNPKLMKDPDHRLEKVHRNAGEIAHFAEWIRLGKNVEEFEAENKVMLFKAYDKKDLFASQKIMCGVQQIICAYNKTRVDLNSKVRKFYGFTKKVEVGERVMCLKNNKKLGLFNGMQGEVISVRKGNSFDIVTDTGKFEKVPFHPDVFGMEKWDQSMDLEGTNPFDYGYAATCHKAQGDEWDEVMVIEQLCPHWDHVRWAYTAASRAKEQLLWVAAYRKKDEDPAGQADAGDWF
jgi:exodeoxyribonuclease-5